MSRVGSVWAPWAPTPGVPASMAVYVCVCVQMCARPDMWVLLCI